MDPTPCLYTIRLNGHLGAATLAAFAALQPRRLGPETVLTGLLDTSALYGVLAQIEALGLDLVEVRRHRETSRWAATNTGVPEMVTYRPAHQPTSDCDGQVALGNPGRDEGGFLNHDSGHAVWLEQARAHLRRADPVLARLIDDQPQFDPRAWLNQLPPMDLYGALLFQVTGQQLSVAATRATLARIEGLFGGRLPAPTELLGVDPGVLRRAGLSWRKINTLRDLAERLSDGRLNPTVLSSSSDDELITELTAIPGIGPWTVQGALIIALGREDVVLPGDLALRKAIRVAYRLDHLPSQQEVLAIAERWRPYRSLATSYLFATGSEVPDAPTVPREKERPTRAT